MVLDVIDIVAIRKYIDSNKKISLLYMVNDLDTLWDFARMCIRKFDIEPKDITLMDDKEFKDYILLCVDKYDAHNGR